MLSGSPGVYNKNLQFARTSGNPQCQEKNNMYETSVFENGTVTTDLQASYDEQHATTARRQFCHKSWKPYGGCTDFGPLLCTGSPLAPIRKRVAARGPTSPTQGAVVPRPKKTGLQVVGQVLKSKPQKNCSSGPMKSQHGIKAQGLSNPGQVSHITTRKPTAETSLRTNIRCSSPSLLPCLRLQPPTPMNLFMKMCGFPRSAGRNIIRLRLCF